MTTEERADQNRINAQKSTGPKSEEGKRRASLNGCRHSLTGQTVLLPTDDHNTYLTFGRRAMDHFKPVGWDEEQQVITIYETEWRLRRIRALESNFQTLHLDRNFNKVPSNAEQAQVALVHAHNSPLTSKELALYSLYESRLNGTLKRANKRLDELQQARKLEEAKQLDEAILLCRAAKAAGEPWQPAEDGFGFSLAEVETAMTRFDRLVRARNLAARAYKAG